MTTKGSNNPFPSILLNEVATDGSDTPTPAADYRRLFLGEDGELHLIDSADVVTDVGGGDVATDAIWNAAGDLAVGTGSDTAARLAMGAEGSALSVMDGVVGWNGATSMPGSPTTGQRIWRSDLAMEFYYDGSQWLTTKLYRETFGIGANTTAISATANIGRIVPWHTTFDMYMVTFYTGTFVATTNNGTDNWIITLRKADASNATSDIVSFNTAADSANTWVTRATAVGALLTPATYKHIVVAATKANSAGNLTWALALSYRLVG